MHVTRDVSVYFVSYGFLQGWKCINKVNLRISKEFKSCLASHTFICDMFVDNIAQIHLWIML